MLFLLCLSLLPQEHEDENHIIAPSGRPITYSAIRDAMDGENFDMSLSRTDSQSVIAAVNQQIDSHLEACFMPDRGDSYEPVEQTIGDQAVGSKLECSVSPESMPTLLRRLLEAGDENAESIGSSILQVLGLEAD